MRTQYDEAFPAPFRHTQFAVYLCFIFAAILTGYDSAQGIVQRYHINKKWFYLYGSMCFFVYLFLRPLIRRRLGSVSRGYINWSTIYAVWLCAAVFYHLPSLDSLGLDVRADVSMLLTVFLLSLLVLGALSAAHEFGVAFRFVSPRLLDPTSGMRQVFTAVILNALTFAIACSTYYSFCGNAAAADTAGLPNPRAADALRSSVCGKWLHPMSAVRHPAFSRWVIYGEAAGNTSAPGAPAPSAGEPAILEVDFPLVGQGVVPVPAAQAISPVFTTWLTLFAMFVANCFADYAASATTQAAYSSGQRRAAAAAKRRSMRRHRRRHSAEYSADWSRHGSMESMQSISRLDNAFSSYASLLNLHLPSRPMTRDVSFDAIMKTVSSMGSIWTPTALEAMGRKAASALLFRDDQAVGSGGIGSIAGQVPKIDGVADATPVPSSLLADPDAAAGVGLPVSFDAPAPSFLPMFPWYSGTSADLLKTLFDLMVSVKVFLGRFDMRTLEAATAGLSGDGAVPSGGAVLPRDGDGYTFEHLAGKEEVWLDFCADTGDGGDPTYSIARCLAARHVTVEVPEEAVAEGAKTGTLLRSGKVRVLPRGQALVHGGDLAYPNPTDETYEQRLFGPYEDAFPPPSHVHPGHMVVNKPDLPPVYWQEAAAAVNGAQRCHCTSSAPGFSPPCRMCSKAGALAAYEGPSAFLIPGNHDWIDGLEVFQRHIVHKGWLGGWLLPQEKSYFALKLPHGWWLLAVDLALVEDIDMCQYRYFAKIAEERMGPDDAAIVITHCPHWLIEWFWGRRLCKNLRHLLRGPLRGRARVHLAGDLHFYMRHSFKPYKAGEGAGGVPGGGSPLASGLTTPAGGSPLQGGSPLSSMSPTPPTFAMPTQSGQLHQKLVDRLNYVASSAGTAGAPSATAAGGSPPSFNSLATASKPITAAARLRNASSSFGSIQDDPLLVISESSEGNGNGPDNKSQHPLSSSNFQQEGVPASSSSGPFGNTMVSAPRPVPGATGTGTTSGTTDGTGIGTGTTAHAVGIPGLPPLPPGSSPLPPSTHPLGASPPPLPGSSPTQGWWGGLRVRTPRRGSSPTESEAGVVAGGSPTLEGGAGAGGGARRAGASAEWEPPPPGWRLNDPEHLVVCGSGGAFLHPSHVFSYSRFRPVHDAAAGPIYIRPEDDPSLGGGGRGGGYMTGNSMLGMRRGHPSSSSLYSLPRREAPSTAGGEYRCNAAFPSPEDSLRLGRANLHTFRHVNSRFDVIGGALYYFLVVSVLPRCSGIGEVLDAHSIGEVARLFATAAIDTVTEIFSQSYVSLAALGVIFAITLGFARSGGVGAIDGVPPAASRRPEHRGFALAVRARMGGFPAQLAFAAAHAAAHLSAAVGLLLLLELGIETVIRFEGVGADGYHSLYRWFQAFEAEHFPDPAGLRGTLSSWTLSLYPNLLKWLFALFDVPEAIAVSRTAVCAAGGSFAALTRLQTMGLYGGVLMYFWMLATPTVGFLFGLYLYISGNWLHVHYDESFSALQVADFKGFLRLHITRDGDLEIFSLGLKDVPRAWKEDPRWRDPGGGGARGVDVAAHDAKWPSRWVPVTEPAGLVGGKKVLHTAAPPEAHLKVVDYLLVKKKGGGGEEG